MAVIHIVTPEYLPLRGGVGDYARAVARGLADAGEEVHVWCPGDGHGEPGDRFAVHPDLGQFGASDLERAGAALNAQPGPRRLLVQWVPHGFGRRSMNLPFCFWLRKRALAGDDIELMVHEPFLAFWEGTWRQTFAAVVHRLMTVVLLSAARRVWVSIPAWEPMWKPYALGRDVPFAWLPIPSSLNEPAATQVALLRCRDASDGRPLVGHLGTYSSLIAPLLTGALQIMLRQKAAPRVLLMGCGAQEFTASLLSAHPEWAGAIRAADALSDADLATHVAACDVLIQPYPDGISSRRTSAMAALKLGVPLVTTHGRLSEPFWRESGAVRLAEVADSHSMAAQVMSLLQHPDARRELSDAGRALYARLFDLNRTIGALRRADAERAA